MGRAYSLDLRERVLQDCDGGMSSEAATRNIRSALLELIRFASGSVKPEASHLKITGVVKDKTSHLTNMPCDSWSSSIPTQRLKNFLRSCPTQCK
jgi:hypothetical protein